MLLVTRSPVITNSTVRGCHWCIIYVVYLTEMSFAHTKQYWIFQWLVKTDFQNMWIEEVLAVFDTLSWRFPAGTGNSYDERENICFWGHIWTPNLPNNKQ